MADEILSRLDALEAKLEGRLDSLEEKVDAGFDRVDRRFDGLQETVSDLQKSANARGEQLAEVLEALALRRAAR